MIAGHAIVCTSRKYTGFGTIALLAEINNIFRFLGQLSRATQFDRSSRLLYSIFLVLSLLTTVVCRFLLMTCLFWFVLTQWGTASIFQFFVGSIALGYFLYTSVDMFRGSWKRLITSRENVCYANGNDATYGEQKHN